MSSSKTYRIEEVPKDQNRVAADEILVPVVHFYKEIYSTFGQPFYLKLKDGEKLESVREKIQRHIDIPDKEFEKYRVAVITVGRPKYLEDMQTDTVRVRDFVHASNQASSNGQKPYIGLEHFNKNSKRARYNYMEKAIRIYN